MFHKTSLPTRSFGNDGPRVSALGLGGEGVLRSFGREAEAHAVIQAARDAGITYVESARAYSGSEAYYGGARLGPRAELFVATKVHDRSFAGARAMLETSLRTMRLDYLDLWQFHDIREPGEVESLEDPGGAYAALVDAKARGLVRYIGVTGHHDPAVLRAAFERVPFDAVLLPINPADGALRDGFERSVVPAARARGMAVIGMKVYAHGLLFQTTDVTADEALRYALAADVDTLVVGADSTEQVAQNAAIARAGVVMREPVRRALEARVAPGARRLAYYRGVG